MVMLSVPIVNVVMPLAPPLILRSEVASPLAEALLRLWVLLLIVNVPIVLVPSEILRVPVPLLEVLELPVRAPRAMVVAFSVPAPKENVPVLAPWLVDPALRVPMERVLSNRSASCPVKSTVATIEKPVLAPPLATFIVERPIPVRSRIRMVPLAPLKSSVPLARLPEPPMVMVVTLNWLSPPPSLIT